MPINPDIFGTFLDRKTANTASEGAQFAAVVPQPRGSILDDTLRNVSRAGQEGLSVTALLPAIGGSLDKAMAVVGQLQSLGYVAMDGGTVTLTKQGWSVAQNLPSVANG